MHLHIAKNVLYQLLARIATAFAGFLITIAIGKYLGASSFGDYTKIITLVGFFYLLSDLGLNAIYLQKDHTGSHFKDLLYVRMAASLILVIFIIVSTGLLPYNQTLGLGFSNQVKQGIVLYSFSIFLYGALLSATAIFQKALEYKKLFIANFLGSAVTLGSVLFVLLRSPSLVMILIALIIGDIAAVIIALFLVRKPLLPVSVDTKFAKNVLRESAPLALMLIFNLVYFRIDTILLSVLKPSHDVGVYGLAYRFFDFLIAIPLFFSNALYPSFLASLKNMRITRTNVQTYSIVFIILSFCLILTSWFLAPLFTLINDSFKDSILAFRLLILSLPFFFFSSLFQWFLIARGHQRYLMWVYVASALFNVFLNIIFIPIASYKASAVITGISEGLVCLLLFIKYKEAVAVSD